MKLQNILDKYSSRMTQVQLYQRGMRKITEKEYDDLLKYEERMGERVNDLKYSSFDRMTFVNAKTGEHNTYGVKRGNTKDQKRSVVLHRNKQYQWLLAEAYEVFEYYLRELYAYVGFIDNNAWPLVDYGNVKLSELAQKPYEWFKEKSDRKQKFPSSVLSVLRDRFPDIVRYESGEYLYVDLYFATILIEQFRHLIVHNGGVAECKYKFVERVMKKSGLYNNGSPSEKYTQFVLGFFGSGECSNMIKLLEVNHEREGRPIGFYTNVFGVISEYMVSYAFLMAESIALKFDEPLITDYNIRYQSIDQSASESDYT